jgi:hypothetical protein
MLHIYKLQTKFITVLSQCDDTMIAKHPHQTSSYISKYTPTSDNLIHFQIHTHIRHPHTFPNTHPHRTSSYISKCTPTSDNLIHFQIHTHIRQPHTFPNTHPHQTSSYISKYTNTSGRLTSQLINTIRHEVIILLCE